MRQLNIDWGELESAFDDSFPEHRYFLDLETGKVVLVTDETSRELEEVYAELPQDAEPAQIVEAIRQRNLPDWQIEALLLADQVERGYGTRFICVAPRDPHADYRDMEAFITTVRDARLRDRLSRAISGRGAFRYFKDVLEDHPRERERWFAFKNTRVRQRMLDWLAAKDIEPIIETNDRVR